MRAIGEILDTLPAPHVRAILDVLTISIPRVTDADDWLAHDLARERAATRAHYIAAALSHDASAYRSPSGQVLSDAEHYVEEAYRLIHGERGRRGTAVRSEADRLRSQFERRKQRLWLEIAARDGLACNNPGCPTVLGLTIDHKIPLSRGGTNDLVNLHFLCAPHNSAKGTKTWDEWLSRLGCTGADSEGPF